MNAYFYFHAHEIAKEAAALNQHRFAAARKAPAKPDSPESQTRNANWKYRAVCLGMTARQDFAA